MILVNNIVNSLNANLLIVDSLLYKRETAGAYTPAASFGFIYRFLYAL